MRASRGARGGPGHGDELEGPLHRLKGVGLLVGRKLLGEAEEHLLGAASRGQKPHPGLHQAHIELGVGLDPVGVQGELRPAPQSQAEGRHHHGEGAIAEGHGGLLELAHRQGELVPVPLLGQGEDEGQVGPGGEGPRVLVADDEAQVTLLLHKLQALLEHADDPLPDGVHLGAELQKGHPIPQVQKGRLLALQEGLALGLEGL